MDTADAPTHHNAASTWAEICERFPDQWVCLLDVEAAADGAIQLARVVSHDASITRALDGIASPNQNMTVVHTTGRPLWTPRFENVDDEEDVVRIHR
jgi:hypothetical protein